MSLENLSDGHVAGALSAWAQRNLPKGQDWGRAFSGWCVPPTPPRTFPWVLTSCGDRVSLWLTFAVLVKREGRERVCAGRPSLCVSDHLPVAGWPSWTSTTTSLSAWRRVQRTWCGD